MTLANIDARILATLRALRSGAWSYKRHHSTQPDLVSSYARDIGYPAIWGEPTLLPAYGGKVADAAWEILGVPGRKGVGGIPCELVHGSVAGGSCTANVAIRGAQAFAEALALYLPVNIYCYSRSLLIHSSSIFTGSLPSNPPCTSTLTLPYTPPHHYLSVCPSQRIFS